MIVSRKSIQPKAALSCLSDTDSRETPLTWSRCHHCSGNKRQFNGADAVSASRQRNKSGLSAVWMISPLHFGIRALTTVRLLLILTRLDPVTQVEVFLPADVGTSSRLWLFHADWRAEFCRLKCCIVLLIRLSQKLIQSCLPLFCFLVFVPTGAQQQRVCYQLRSVIAITLVTNMTHYHLSESSVCRRCFQCTKLNLIQSCRVCDE